MLPRGSHNNLKYIKEKDKQENLDTLRTFEPGLRPTQPFCRRYPLFQGSYNMPFSASGHTSPHF
jgi:hypothetical protein